MVKKKMCRISTSVSCKITSSWCVENILKYTLLTIFVAVIFCEVTTASETIKENESPEQVTEFAFFNTSIDSNSSSSTTNEPTWEDGNWRRKDRSKIAAIAVYCSVILIAIFGILVKYFVTQYEVLQAKAQLEYQQLRNV